MGIQLCVSPEKGVIVGTSFGRFGGNRSSTLLEINFAASSPKPLISIRYEILSSEIIAVSRYTELQVRSYTQIKGTYIRNNP